MTTEELATQALDSAKSAHKRIDTLESEVRDIRQLTAAMARVNEKVDGLGRSVDELKDDVKMLTTRPAKLWDKLAFGAVGALSAGIVGAILALVIK